MRRVVGQLLDALIDLADERLILGALLGMGVLRSLTGSSVVFQRFTAADSGETSTPANGQRGSVRKPRARREFDSASSAA
jgi:hypothetical protein